MADAKVISVGPPVAADLSEQDGIFLGKTTKKTVLPWLTTLFLCSQLTTGWCR